MSSPATSIEVTERVERSRPVLPPLVLFSCGHFIIDMYSIALGVLQPLLLVQFGMSLTQAGLLGGMLVFSSSVLQPVYGYLSDRFHTRLFSVLAPAVAGLFISTLGLASGYWMLLAMVWLGGAGIGSFHPQATANATLGIKSNRGRAMATFISAGTLGMAIARYMVVVERGDTSWGAHVPDLPGCVAIGETRDDVLQLIREAIELHIDGLKQDGLPVPSPSSDVEFVEIGAA